VDYLVLVLSKRQAASNATAIPTGSSDDTSATRALVTSKLTAYIRVATPGTLPESLARTQDGHYAIAVYLRAKSTAAWQEHWIVVRAGQEIIYVAIGVPGTDPTRRRELAALMSSITLSHPDDRSAINKSADEEPRKGDLSNVP
jgi:hypothetical protein